MKKLLTIILFALLYMSALAQAPEKMSYQAVIRDASNNLISSSAVGMRISILQTTSTGTEVYVETHTPTTSATGLVSLEIGTGTVVTGTFAGINWGADAYFLKMETDPTGGTNYTISGTSQFISVPYTLYAKTAQSATGLPDPVNAQDAVTRAYLESRISALREELYTSGALVIPPGTYIIGDFALGGVVAYVLQPGDPGYDANSQHGFIVAVTDQGTAAVWGCSSFAINGADGTAIGTGKQNTKDIMTVCNVGGIAATRCDILVVNGYDDWYLPSKDELNKLFLNRTAIGAKAAAKGGTGFVSDYYWSSSENDLNYAWAQSFALSGSQDSSNKVNTYYVRAIRAF